MSRFDEYKTSPDFFFMKLSQNKINNIFVISQRKQNCVAVVLPHCFRKRNNEYFLKRLVNMSTKFGIKHTRSAASTQISTEIFIISFVQEKKNIRQFTRFCKFLLIQINLYVLLIYTFWYSQIPKCLNSYPIYKIRPSPGSVVVAIELFRNVCILFETNYICILAVPHSVACARYWI